MMKRKDKVLNMIPKLLENILSDFFKVKRPIRKTKTLKTIMAIKNSEKSNLITKS